MRDQLSECHNGGSAALDAITLVRNIKEILSSLEKVGTPGRR